MPVNNHTQYRSAIVEIIFMTTQPDKKRKHEQTTTRKTRGLDSLRNRRFLQLVVKPLRKNNPVSTSLNVVLKN